YDAKELGGSNDTPSDAERACIAMFRARGILLSPDLPASSWPARRELLAGAEYVPAVIPLQAPGDAVRAWIAATADTHQIPFAIPIDEPHTADARGKVRALASEVRAARTGAGR